MDEADVDLRLRALGERLRALRLERGASLGEMARGTGLSSSFLSLVENGRSDISTGRLLRVASFLGVDPAGLLDLGRPPDVTVVRVRERRASETFAEGLGIVSVLGGAEDLTMAPVLCEYEVGAHSDGLPAMDETEHFVFVEQGAIEISIAHAEPLSLEAGDCAYIRSGGDSGVRNAADHRSVAVWVSSSAALARARDALVPGPATD